MARTYIDVAQLTSKVGLDGRFAIDVSANLSFLLSFGREVWLVPPQIDVPRCVHVKNLNTQGDSLTISFEEIDNIDISEKLVGSHCLVVNTEEVDRAVKEAVSNDPLNLISWSFIDRTSGTMGIVLDAYNNAGQLMLEVEHLGHTSLVPYVDDFIEVKDDESETIIMNCPFGLFDL